MRSPNLVMLRCSCCPTAAAEAKRRKALTKEQRAAEDAARKAAEAAEKAKDEEIVLVEQEVLLRGNGTAAPAGKKVRVVWMCCCQRSGSKRGYLQVATSSCCQWRSVQYNFKALLHVLLSSFNSFCRCIVKQVCATAVLCSLLETYT